ncbi:MAG TPA: HD domain-containing protein [Fervidobacterium sp.]|nr:phosphohydrolase [Fervidobacterium sp.]HOK87980.1 HD domain-containing protein [Fervidobacterium sp.]HOM74366.1 HD domain-containing protein [Fervidobacterium sp.]HOQ40339.1 HD domain-containing protein [Fervidobacterium sp.]HRD20739.1 HD domain-containing protein [Fervidobacterium sp.]
MGRGNFLFSLTNLLTIQRWNNRPAVLRFSEADNAYNTFFLSFVFRTMKGENFEPALRWRLSRELPKIVLSDISLQLKERIERFSPHVWSDVTQKAVNELSITADKEFVDLLIDDSPQCEQIDKLADLYISYLEAYENGKLFDYSQPIKELEEKIKHLSESFAVEDVEKYWDVAKHVWIPLLNLTSMVRWNRTHRNIRSTVSGHSFMVLVISYLIAKLVRYNDIEEIIMRATLHDLPEAFTGDVISPTKKKTEELEELVSAVEREMVTEWVNSSEHTKILAKYVSHCTDPFSGEGGHIVRTSDYFAALLECGVEIYSGNRLDIFRDNFFSFKKMIKEISPMDVSDWIDEVESIAFLYH